jgi:hypothetical protein
VSAQTRAGITYESDLVRRCRAAGLGPVDRQPYRGIHDTADIDGFPDIEGTTAQTGIILGARIRGSGSHGILAVGMDDLDRNRVEWLAREWDMGYRDVFAWQVFKRRAGRGHKYDPGRDFVVCEWRQWVREAHLLTGTGDTP